MKRIDIPPPTRLDAKDLRVVVAVAEHGTTARAAKSLHLTQPATSRALLAAERRLGVELFVRTAAGLVPNDKGRELVAGAKRLLVELRDLEHRLRGPAEKPLRLRVVCECYTAYHWLPSALAELRASLPGLELELAIAHTGAPVEALEAGQVDVALLTTATVPRGLEERALFSDEIVFVVGRGHPLAKKPALRAEDLARHKIVSGNTPPDEVRWFLRSVFGKKTPALAYERFPLTEAIVDVCRANLGVGVLSEWISGPHLGRGDLVVKRLAKGPLVRPWRIAYRAEIARAAERLVPALRASAPRRLAEIG